MVNPYNKFPGAKFWVYYNNYFQKLVSNTDEWEALKAEYPNCEFHQTFNYIYMSGSIYIYDKKEKE